jgi:hypothetical protein
VPITYFLSNVSNLSADALALLVSGLVLKCQRRVKGYEPALEGAIRLALRSRWATPARTPANIEVKWAEMETRSMAQAADAAVKLTQGDNPVITPQTAQEKWLGMSQTERDRDDAWRAEGRRRRPRGVLSAARPPPCREPADPAHRAQQLLLRRATVDQVGVCGRRWTTSGSTPPTRARGPRRAM